MQRDWPGCRPRMRKDGRRHPCARYFQPNRAGGIAGAKEQHIVDTVSHGRPPWTMLLWRTAGRQVRDQRLTQLRSAAAAVLGEEAARLRAASSWARGNRWTGSGARPGSAWPGSGSLSEPFRFPTPQPVMKLAVLPLFDYAPRELPRRLRALRNDRRAY